MLAVLQQMSRPITCQRYSRLTCTLSAYYIICAHPRIWCYYIPFLFARLLSGDTELNVIQLNSLSVLLTSNLFFTHFIQLSYLNYLFVSELLPAISGSLKIFMIRSSVFTIIAV